MPVNEQYECDCEFFKMLTRRCDVNLTTVALELARDAYPRLDFQTTLDWFDARAEELSGPIARAKSEADVLAELGRCLAQVHGITGDKRAYEHPDGSYLNRVIETKRGIPISLSALYMGVAERAGNRSQRRIGANALSTALRVGRRPAVHRRVRRRPRDEAQRMQNLACRADRGAAEDLRSALRPVDARQS